jgi:YXWGXW repeat-containing protein
MRTTSVLLIAILGTSLIGCSSAPTERAPRRHVRIVEVHVAPPPLRVVAVPAPRRGYVWAPGYWRWDGHRHVWADGRWMRERRGERWVPAHWEQGRAGYWHFEPGHWER